MHTYHVCNEVKCDDEIENKVDNTDWMFVVRLKHHIWVAVACGHVVFIQENVLSVNYDLCT